MRWLISLIFVLALSVSGCGQGLGPMEATDCAEADDRTRCILDGAIGLCMEGECLPYDCSGFENGTTCLLDYPDAGLFVGFCDEGVCVVEVG